MELAGGCLCGSVRYSCNASPLRTAICHCTHCQKQSGTAFSIVVAVPAQSVRVDGKTVDYQDVGDSGGAVIRRFCGNCGSPLISEIVAQPDIWFIKAGTLDDTSDLKPDVHIWCESKQPWVTIDGDLPSFPKARAAS